MKKSFEKLKDNIPEMGHFARRHMSETLTVAALIIGAVSAWRGIFIGGAFWTLIFLVAGAVLGIFFPTHVDGILKKVCQVLYKKEKISEVIAGSITIVIALFIPIAYFGFFGMLAGSAYHYFTRFAQGHSDKNG